MSVKLLIEHDLEFLRLKGGCTGLSESTLVKMPHYWKSHAMAHMSESTQQAHDVETTWYQRRCHTKFLLGTFIALILKCKGYHANAPSFTVLKYNISRYSHIKCFLVCYSHVWKFIHLCYFHSLKVYYFELFSYVKKLFLLYYSRRPKSVFLMLFANV